MKDKTQTVYIEFLDHKSRAEWQDIEDLKTHGPITCYALGFLSYEDDIAYRVSATRAADGDFGDTICIVKSTVTKFRKLNVKL